MRVKRMYDFYNIHYHENETYDFYNINWAEYLKRNIGCVLLTKYCFTLIQPENWVVN
jgi:hypothetical protein